MLQVVILFAEGINLPNVAFAWLPAVPGHLTHLA